MPGGRFMCYVCLVFFAGILVLLSLRTTPARRWW
jgi:D-serine/D-alanine/glycine transporter